MKFFSKSLVDFPHKYYPNGTMPKVNLSCDPTNKFGYRCREFDDRGDVNILFLGDEWSLGESLDFGLIYSSLVCEKLSAQCGFGVHGFNLSHRDKGYDYISRTIWCALRTLNPDFVFICFPDMSRREYFALNGRCIDFSPAKASAIAEKRVKVNRIERELIGTMRDLCTRFDEPINALKNYVLIEALMSETGIPWAVSVNGNNAANEHLALLFEKKLFNKERFMDFTFDLIDVAPDNETPGVKSHEVFGNQLFTWLCDNMPSIRRIK